MRLGAEQEEQPLAGTGSARRSGVPDAEPLEAAVATAVDDSGTAHGDRGLYSISPIRYCDMVSARSGRRTMIVTDRANLERWMAACPAELPPPTTTTSWPSISRAAVIALP